MRGLRERKSLVWLILGAVLVVIMNLPLPVSQRIKAWVRESVAPLQQGVTGFFGDLGEATRTMRGLRDQAEENRRMAEELVILRNEQIYYRNIKQHNKELRNQLDFRQASDQLLIPCEVVARDISGWWQTVRLSGGTRDGVEVGRAVVTIDGVLGKTVNVSRNTCDVLLLSDPGCKVSAVVTRSGAFGIISGTGVGKDNRLVLKMDFINQREEIRLNQEVLTSGLGGVFPKGLLIGYVEKVYQDEKGLFQSADIVPKADFQRLNYAFVIALEEDPVSELLRRKREARGNAGP